ncbi:MAG: hypothetical protein PVJ62_00600 [Deltaproteobacteria bacterium]|jgi:hypothetical protein
MDNSGSRFFEKPAVRVISIAVGLSLVLLAAVWIRAFYGSMRAYQQGEAYFEKQEYVRAITFFDRSIHWYTPFNPYVRKSARHLWKICSRAEQQGDIQLALIAARTIRRGFLGTRSFYVPGRAWIRECDKKIASLTGKASGDQGTDEDAASPSVQQENLEPDVWWTLVLEVGLFGWIGSVIGFLMHGLTRGQTAALRSGRAVFWGLMVMVFYTLWIVGMIRS